MNFTYIMKVIKMANLYLTEEELAFIKRKVGNALFMRHGDVYGTRVEMLKKLETKISNKLSQTPGEIKKNQERLKKMEMERQQEQREREKRKKQKELKIQTLKQEIALLQSGYDDLD